MTTTRSGVSGLDLIWPGDARYDSVRHVYTAAGSPAAVIQVREEAEVAAALEYARTHAGPFSVRSGGHGISSIATNTGGTVIDLSRLNAITPLGGTRVRLEPGARWGRVARELFPHGLAISSGDSGDVGVGGLATTGGIGLLGRSQGLTIDRMVSARIVTADGTVHAVSETEEPDLFWAIRGAGANLGIVTSFEFDASPLPTVAHATLAYRPRDMTGFLQRWGTLVETAPREISAFLYLGGGFAQASVVYAGDDQDAATRALQPFTDDPDIAGGQARIAPYATVPMTTGAPHTGAQSAHTRTGLADHVTPAIAHALAGLLDRVEMVQIRSAGGAINDVPEDATAYAHRHQNFSITAASSSPRGILDAAWEPSRALMDGMYLSFESDHTPDSIHAAFPPATLSRLRAIKNRHDPDRVFTQNFDISSTRQ